MTETATVVELAKRRGYFFQSSRAYGGVSGFYTYGPQGAALKENIEDTWRERFTLKEGNFEVDAPIVMPEPVFEASGHLDGFDDMLVECPECHASHRADHIIEDNTGIEEAESLPIPEVENLLAEHELTCPNCGADLAGQAIEEFNLMFQTSIGPGSSQPGYLRPETAQGIFVEFPQLKEYARNQLPFGVTQIGPAYRNEISPRKSLLRLREFTQAELELFIDPEEDEPALDVVRDVEAPLYSAEMQESDDSEPVTMAIGDAVDEGIISDAWVAYYLGLAKQWYTRIGIDMEKFRFRQHLSGELAHYAADCWDAEALVDGDWIELAGFANRGDYDLSKHGSYSDEDFTLFKQYDEPKHVERATVDPDMSYLGPEFGGAAADIGEALQTLAERDRSAFDGDSVEVEVDGEAYEIPSEHVNFEVSEETEAGEHIVPHVIEPSFGVDRALYTVVHHAYREDEVEGEERSYLALKPEVAPTFVGVFPLTSKDGLPETAQSVATELRERGLSVAYDDSGSIGRRYRRQDEVGTPFCVTLDADPEGTATIRERDSTEQVRVDLDELADVLTALRTGERTFDTL
ncbi:glycine--tRNA ligase [Haloarchaeobius sp. HME9146]|uniref:glycine--tRNA ligase n=1 Tax=Haloarchaeobius sp. HME9146 TaxID=2978732 RepID=UPI0021C17B8D|nr:glycine--tRNA ligase [Haloarchaeobius sp. HME9146]MCT9094805.1 glycine--tRNA ligase [Haloarchaeobius sp. HME9146]